MARRPFHYRQTITPQTRPVTEPAQKAAIRPAKRPGLPTARQTPRRRPARQDLRVLGPVHPNTLTAAATSPTRAEGDREAVAWAPLECGDLQENSAGDERPCLC